MSSHQFDPQRDLRIQRVLHAPKERVWRAWTDPELLQKWWVPAPTVARIERFDPTAGGAFVTQMSDDGENFVPHTDGIFLLVEHESRIAFTNAISSSWHPALPAPMGMTAEITLSSHPEGTDYLAIVRHADPQARAKHEELGFYEGWGAVTEALANLSESL